MAGAAFEAATNVSAHLVAPILSAELRARTAPMHAQVETLLGLPEAIRTGDDYRAWLGRFLGLYEPLERSLAAFHGWQALGLDLTHLSQSARLADDLEFLGTDPRTLSRAPVTLLPDLPTLAQAMGALYVLEGSALGGRIILRNLDTRIGPQIMGATQFFDGRGEALGPMWLGFKTVLDNYGRQHPLLQADVIAGAENTFGAILNWFIPFRAVTDVAA